MKNKKAEYPSWVCFDCGKKASGGKSFGLSCWHNGTCGVCGDEKPVTQPRDFFYPDFKEVLNGKVKKY
jgi:hypothetical protein